MIVNELKKCSYTVFSFDVQSALTDNLYTPLELIHSSRDAKRKVREAYLTDKDQTVEPKGIRQA